MSGIKVDRRAFLGTGGAAALAARPDVVLAQAATPGPSPSDAVLWIGSRPGRFALDDAPAHVAARFGWFEPDRVAMYWDAVGAGAALWVLRERAISVDGTPTEPSRNGPTFVGVASPLELLTARRQGIDVVSIAQHVWRDGSLVVVPKGALGTPPKPGRLGDYVKALPSERQRLFVGAETWRPAAELLLERFGKSAVGIGIEPVGADWAQEALKRNAPPPGGGPIAEVEGGAAMGWLGLTPLWAEQKLDFEAVSPPGDMFPGACLVARAADLQDPTRRGRLGRFLRGWAMGLDFALRNHAAAVQVVAEALPRGPQAVVPEGGEKLAVRRLAEALNTHCPGPVVDEAWGRHDAAAWKRLTEAAATIRLLGGTVEPKPAVNDELLAEALQFDSWDRAPVREAKRFPLNDRYRPEPPA